MKIPEGIDVHEYLRSYILSHGLKGGFIIGIGGFKRAIIGYLDPATRTYVTQELEARNIILEVASLMGNYVVKNNEVSIHIHVTLSTPEGARGGHLLKSTVYPFIEALLVEVGSSIKEVFTHR